MSTQLERSLQEREGAPAAPEGRGVVDLIRRLTPEMQRALPRHLDGDRMARLALTELRRTPQLQQASTESLLGALMWAAQLGLEPGPLGHVYLVPRRIQGRTEVVFVIGYRGLLELAYRSGQVESIHSRVVWRGETFRFHAGDEERITHEPNLALDPTPQDFESAYAVAHLRGGGVVREVIGPRHIARAQAGSSIPAGKGPWATDFEAMARKTAIRRLASLLPQSAELAAALNVDETPAPRLDRGFVDVAEAEPRPVELEAAEGGPGYEATQHEAAAVDAGRVGEAISDSQRRRMHALMRERGLGRTQRRELASRILERSVASTNDLTSGEARRVIDVLELSRPSNSAAPEASALPAEERDPELSETAAEATPHDGTEELGVDERGAETQEEPTQEDDA